MGNPIRCLFGINIQALAGHFQEPFQQQLQVFLKGLPGAVAIENSARDKQEWQLHGSAAALAQNNLETFSGTTVVVGETAIALHFTHTTFEEHEAQLIHWIRQQQDCKLQDLDYGTDITEPIALAQWMKSYGVGDSQIQDRAAQMLDQALPGAICNLIQWDDMDCISLLFRASNAEQLCFRFPSENLVMATPQLSLEPEQAALLQVYATCGSAITSVEFSGERVLHLIFDDDLSLSITTNHALGVSENAWELAVPKADGSWETVVWIRQGGDLVCGDR